MTESVPVSPDIFTHHTFTTGGQQDEHNLGYNDLPVKLFFLGYEIS